MRTIVLESDGFSPNSFLTDAETKQQLCDVVRMEFSDLDVNQREPWTAILHFFADSNKEPETVFIQVSPRKS